MKSTEVNHDPLGFWQNSQENQSERASKLFRVTQLGRLVVPAQPL